MEDRKIIWDNSLPNHNCPKILNDRAYIVYNDYNGDYIISESGINLYNLDGFLNIDEYLFKTYGYTTKDVLYNKRDLNGTKYVYNSISNSVTNKKDLQIYISSLDGNIVGVSDPGNFISLKQERNKIINDILE